MTHTSAEMIHWNRLYFVVTTRLAGTTLDKSVVNRVLNARGLPVVP